MMFFSIGCVVFVEDEAHILFFQQHRIRLMPHLHLSTALEWMVLAPQWSAVINENHFPVSAPMPMIHCQMKIQTVVVPNSSCLLHQIQK